MPLILVMPTVIEIVKFLAAKALDARCEPKMEKIGCTKDYFRVPVRVGLRDITLDHVVVHQPVNDVGCFFFRGADHRGMPHEIAHIDKCHHADALGLAKVLRTAD